MHSRLMGQEEFQPHGGGIHEGNNGDETTRLHWRRPALRRSLPRMQQVDRIGAIADS